MMWPIILSNAWGRNLILVRYWLNMVQLIILESLLPPKLVLGYLHVIDGHSNYNFKITTFLFIAHYFYLTMSNTWECRKVDFSEEKY